MDMFLRLLLILLLVFWVVPLFRRSMPGRRRPRADAEVARDQRNRDEHLANLTRQDISDGEFEELPPEK
jgi:hypothetical protein